MVFRTRRSQVNGANSHANQNNKYAYVGGHILNVRSVTRNKQHKCERKNISYLFRLLEINRNGRESQQKNEAIIDELMITRQFVRTSYRRTSDIMNDVVFACAAAASAAAATGSIQMVVSAKP